MNNYFDMKILSFGENEAFARNAVAAFCLPLNPTLDELQDVKTAVSEAITNCVVHAYEEIGEIDIRCELLKDKNAIEISITDYGKGIDDIKKAREPLFTTKADDERSGMGFTIMESFMDDVSVSSNINVGTTVTLKKVFSNA